MYGFGCQIIGQKHKKVLLKPIFYRVKLVLPNFYNLLILLTYIWL